MIRNMFPWIPRAEDRSPVFPTNTSYHYYWKAFYYPLTTITRALQSIAEQVPTQETPIARALQSITEQDPTQETRQLLVKIWSFRKLFLGTLQTIY